jgi:hypothetical protein
MDCTGEVFFCRANPESDADNPQNKQPRTSFQDSSSASSSSSSDDSDGEAPVAVDHEKNKCYPAAGTSRVGQRQFIAGEQHYLKDKLIFVPHEQNSVLDGDLFLSTPPVKCGIEPVHFDKLMKYVENLNTTEDGSTSASVMFASEMLSYYRPKGRLALLSPFLHVSLIMLMCVPTLALFTFW